MKTNYRCESALQQFYTGGPFAISSDGSFMACACGDTVKIVFCSNASVKETIEEMPEAVTALALSPDDNILFSSGHSRQIRVWDLSSKKCLRSWKGHDGPVMAMACHASGGLLATAGADRKVLVWDIDGGFCTHYFSGHKGVVSCVKFHPDVDKHILFSGSDDSNVRVWDLLTKKCLATLENHFSAISSMDISDDGQILVTAGRDKVVNIWGLNDYSLIRTIPTYEILESICIIPLETHISSFAKSFQPAGKSSCNFVTAGERGILRIWNSDSSACIYEQNSSDFSIITDSDESRRGFIGASILPKDQGLLCVTADQQFLIYSPDEKATQLLPTKRLIGNNEEILDMKFVGDDEQFLAVATNLEQVRVYDMASMTCSDVLSGHTEIVLCLDTCVSNSGKSLIVTGSKDKKVMLWDAEAKKCIGIGTGHTEGVGAVAFSRKSKTFFVSGSSDRTIKVWNFDHLSDDSEEAIALTTKAVVGAHEKDINSLAIAPNDSLVCSGSQDRTARIWKLPNLVSVSVLKGHKRGIWSVEFSPVDKCVITASGDKTVKIWAIEDGSCLKTFEGHTSSVLRALFLTRGMQFVSCGSDGLVKLWNVKSNECIATYDQHEDKIWALAVGKKSEILASGGGDSIINLWVDSTASEKEDAFQKKEEEVLRGQELENALQDLEYAKAIQLAFELRRPHRLLHLFTDLRKNREAEKHIVEAFKSLGSEEQRQMLEYIREWNTKPKTCHVAQYVLAVFFRVIPPTEILKIRGVSDMVEGLIPYSRRHFSRADRLVRSAYLVEYTLRGMSVLEPVLQDVLLKQEPLDDNSEKVLKKRKSIKSKDLSNKKSKSVAVFDASNSPSINV